MKTTLSDRPTCSTAIAVVVAAFLLTGCSATESSKPSFWPFGKSGREQAIRKQLDADPFPTAQQSGLKPVQ